MRSTVVGLHRGMRVMLMLGDVPWKEAPEGDVLDDHTLPEHFRLNGTVNFFLGT